MQRWLPKTAYGKAINGVTCPLSNEQLRRIVIWAVALAGVSGPLLDGGAALIDGRLEIAGFYFLGAAAWVLVLRHVDTIKAKVDE